MDLLSDIFWIIAGCVAMGRQHFKDHDVKPDKYDIEYAKYQYLHPFYKDPETLFIISPLLLLILAAIGLTIADSIGSFKLFKVISIIFIVIFGAFLALILWCAISSSPMPHAEVNTELIEMRKQEKEEARRKKNSSSSSTKEPS